MMNEEIFHQFANEKEMANHLGIDIDTMEGDYAEAFHWLNKKWDKIEIDTRFNHEP
jgi:hypothetical protein